MSEQKSKSRSVQDVMNESPYPPEAAAFIQEGLAYTVESLHGEMSEPLKWLHVWMGEKDRQIDYNELCRLYDEGSLPVKVRRIVDELGGPEQINRHIGGDELCWGLRDLALRRWGQMARTVLHQWSITETLDFGRIVFTMVDNNDLQKQPDDKVEDFENIYDFCAVFDRGYQFPDRDLKRDS